jgi:hypothetical protein
MMPSSKKISSVPIFFLVSGSGFTMVTGLPISPADRTYVANKYLRQGSHPGNSGVLARLDPKKLG